LKSDYSAMYSAVSEVVTTGSDLSVFWQELIDAYRDVMVVKTASDAKNYLDLTDAEYERLSSVASSVTLSRLLYHTSVLESTLADLQRARESKRSIAEIALAKMCDAKLDGGTEALLLRIEELEKAVSRLKFGAIAADEAKPAEKGADIKRAAEPKAEGEKRTAANPINESKPLPQATVYTNWSRVVSGIEGAKASIYSPLSKAVALRQGEFDFTIKIDGFFVKIISDSRENMAIIKGLIAECEGIPAERINVNVVQKQREERATLADEIENAFK